MGPHPQSLGPILVHSQTATGGTPTSGCSPSSVCYTNLHERRWKITQNSWELVEIRSRDIYRVASRLPSDLYPYHGPTLWHANQVLGGGSAEDMASWSGRLLHQHRRSAPSPQTHLAPRTSNIAELQYFMNQSPPSLRAPVKCTSRKFVSSAPFWSTRRWILVTRL
jgi:hypothetical protein